MRRLAVLLSALALFAACSEPPQKEIDRAQGAIDAARAAGAEQYASETFTAATSALQQAHDAVQQRDYRLALSHALDASERAQDAAREAADGKATARSRTEATAAATATLMTQLEGRIKAAEAARIPPKSLEGVRKGTAAAAAALQKARAEIQQGKYPDAEVSLKEARGGIEAQIRAVDEVIAARPAKPARPTKRRTPVRR